MRWFSCVDVLSGQCYYREFSFLSRDWNVSAIFMPVRILSGLTASLVNPLYPGSYLLTLYECLEIY